MVKKKEPKQLEVRKGQKREKGSSRKRQLPGAPRTDPKHAELPHWAPASGQNAKMPIGIGVAETDERNPAGHQPLHASPGHPRLLTPAEENAAPQADDRRAK